MSKEELLSTLRVVFTIALAVILIFLGLKLFGLMFDAPRDVRDIQAKNCAQSGGTLVYDNGYYKTCNKEVK